MFHCGRSEHFHVDLRCNTHVANLGYTYVVFPLLMLCRMSTLRNGSVFWVKSSKAPKSVELHLELSCLSNSPNTPTLCSSKVISQIRREEFVEGEGGGVSSITFFSTIF